MMPFILTNAPIVFNRFPMIDFLDIFMVISLNGLLISKTEEEHDFQDCQMDPWKVLKI